MWLIRSMTLLREVVQLSGLQFELVLSGAVVKVAAGR